jgi:hypothetical protein
MGLEVIIAAIITLLGSIGTAIYLHIKSNPKARIKENQRLAQEPEAKKEFKELTCRVLESLSIEELYEAQHRIKRFIEKYPDYPDAGLLLRKTDGAIEYEMRKLNARTKKGEEEKHALNPFLIPLLFVILLAEILRSEKTRPYIILIAVLLIVFYSIKDVLIEWLFNFSL